MVIFSCRWAFLPVKSKGIFMFIKMHAFIFLGKKIPLFLHVLTPGKRQSLENVEKSVEKK